MKFLVELGRSLLSGVIILMLTMMYLVGSLGLLVIFALGYIVFSKKRTRQR
jgi:hypothetical protein